MKNVSLWGCGERKRTHEENSEGSNRLTAMYVPDQGLIRTGSAPWVTGQSWAITVGSCPTSPWKRSWRWHWPAARAPALQTGDSRCPLCFLVYAPRSQKLCRGQREVKVMVECRLNTRFNVGWIQGSKFTTIIVCARGSMQSSNSQVKIKVIIV